MSLWWCCWCVQERDLKTFHESLKQDMKLMKQSIDMLPKDMRKDMLRQRKEEKDVERAEKVMKVVIA